MFILAPLDPGGPRSQGDELLRSDGLSIQAQRAEARRTKGGDEVLGEEAAPSPPARGSGERCKLPQQSLGRSQGRIYRGRHWIWCVLT